MPTETRREEETNDGFDDVGRAGREGVRHLSRRVGNVARGESGSAPRRNLSPSVTEPTGSARLASPVYLWRSNVRSFAASDVGVDARVTRLRCFGDFQGVDVMITYFMPEITIWNYMNGTGLTLLDFHLHT